VSRPTVTIDSWHDHASVSRFRRRLQVASAASNMDQTVTRMPGPVGCCSLSPSAGNRSRRTHDADDDLRRARAESRPLRLSERCRRAALDSDSKLELEFDYGRVQVNFSGVILFEDEKLCGHGKTVSPCRKLLVHDRGRRGPIYPVRPQKLIIGPEFFHVHFC
jgi:hypothetical protein